MDMPFFPCKFSFCLSFKGQEVRRGKCRKRLLRDNRIAKKLQSEGGAVSISCCIGTAPGHLTREQPTELNLEQTDLLLVSCQVTSNSLGPMDRPTPGFPVLHYLLEFAQIHVLPNHLILCYLLILPFPSPGSLHNPGVEPQSPALQTNS